MDRRRFPIQGAPSIPWFIIGPQEQQAGINHSGQTLEQIAERGGLSPYEALCVIEGNPYSHRKFKDRKNWGAYLHAQVSAELESMVRNMTDQIDRAINASGESGDSASDCIQDMLEILTGPV